MSGKANGAAFRTLELLMVVRRNERNDLLLAIQFEIPMPSGAQGGEPAIQMQNF